MNPMQQWPLQTTAAMAPWLFGLAFDAPLIGVLQRWSNRLHAITMEAVIDDGLSRRHTFTSACGISKLRLLGRTIEGTQIAALWPPSTRDMPEDLSRCVECHELTGRKRPRTKWRES